MREITMNVSLDEVRMLIYGCLAAKDAYCLDRREEEPYNDMLEKLEAIEAELMRGEDND